MLLRDKWEVIYMFLPGYAAGEMLCSLISVKASYARACDVFGPF
jgi:hypothetical protein